MIDLVRVRAVTMYVIEARLSPDRPWKRITDGKEWPPYNEKEKAVRVAKKLKKDMPHKRC